MFGCQLARDDERPITGLGGQDLGGAAVVAAVQHDGCAGLEQASGDAVADPRRHAGDDGDAVVQRQQPTNWRWHHQGRSPTAGRITRRSVTIAVTRSAGVTSNARFRAPDPSGATRWVPAPSTSSGERSSISMSSPLRVDRSSVDSGAATTNGMPARAAARASGYVPILLATSPLAAM